MQVAVVINLKSKRFEYYDSMFSLGSRIIDRFQRFLEGEAIDKKKALDLPPSKWPRIYMDCPKQRNGCAERERERERELRDLRDRELRELRERERERESYERERYKRERERERERESERERQRERETERQ